MTRFFHALIATLFVIAAPGVLLSQTDPTLVEDRVPAYEVKADGTPDYAAWTKVANRVERAIEVGRASDFVLNELRVDLTDWRDLFEEAQKDNSIRINTLKTQLATLGPEPAEPGSEAAVLTQRRADLTKKLSAAQLPVQEAGEAYSRADVLIREIDSVLRNRQTSKMFALGPSPLNPALWPNAVANIGDTLDQTADEVRKNWGSEAQRTYLKSDYPVIIVLLLLAVVLLTRSRSWIIRLGDRLRRRRKGPTRGVIGFAMSIGQVVAPLIGVFALIEALNLAGILGLRGQVIIDALPQFGLLLFSSLWIGTRLFSGDEGTQSLIPLPTIAQRAEARFNTVLLGTLLGVLGVLNRLIELEKYSAGTIAVLMFPIILATGYLLLRMARILRRHYRADADGDMPVFRDRMIVILARAAELVAMASPIAAAIGYTTLAASVLFPAVLTMAIVAVISLLSVFMTNFYGVLRKLSEEEADQALIPVLLTSGLVLLSLPILALVWGVRATELSELWSSFQQGFKLGEARVTPRTFMLFALIFSIGYAATRAIQSALRSSILPKTKLDIGGQNAISVGVGYVGIFLAAVIAITSAGIDLSSIAIIAGALSVGIGFGLQTIVSNFVSGIILLIERPISEGDWIEVGGQMGHVRDISVRSTRIETFDRTDVILPNSDLVSGVVTNFTRGNSIGRVIVPVGVAYGCDTRRVETILREIAEAHPMVTVNPAPAVVFQGFGASSLDFEIRAILSDVNFMLTVKSELNHEIARRFTEEGIEIPFAQRDIWLRNPEVLTQQAALSAASATQTLTKDALTVDDLDNGDADAAPGEGDE